MLGLLPKFQGNSLQRVDSKLIIIIFYFQYSVNCKLFIDFARVNVIQVIDRNMKHELKNE